ncbi:MAG: recombinase family protein [Defluviitaleaceae bacterium]|nr:recombinase family protein [Defluviitaleaceae bacterium]MCL2836338.1 recombinase family protein [Defluviitaleaceae bacterium]
MNRTISSYERTWKAASYIRLSKEDEKAKGGIRESESILNQRNLLLGYINDNNFTLVKEYVDDGVSGTTFDRPQFNAMIEDIERGLINMVITKDMSRLGRDYIQAGHYMEQYFPSKNVRYISLLDNIDTYLDSSNNDIAPFKAILNDMYSKDISKKIRSVLKSKKEQGKFVGRAAPYGYQKSPEDKHKLVVDPIAGLVVERVFSLFLSGKGVCQIADMLSQDGVPIPSVHNKIKVGNAGMSYGLWSHTGVRRLLQNEVYTGTLIQNKYKKLNYKSKKLVQTDPSVWIMTPEAHERIISHDDFQKAQRLLEVTSHLKPSKHRYLLSGLLKCHDCGSYISLTPKDKKYGQIYGRCGRYIEYHKFGLCTTHSFNYTKLEDAVVKKVRELCARYVDPESVNLIYADAKRNKSSAEAKIKLLEKELSKAEKRIDLLYDDRVNGVISVENFKRLSQKANEDCQRIKNQLDELNEAAGDNPSKGKQERIIREFLSLEEPTQAIMAQLINRIEIYENQNNSQFIEICFVFPELQVMLNQENGLLGNIGQ